MFKGGVARNIVADTAEVGVEVRSADDGKLEREAEKVIEAFRTAAESLGLAPVLWASGGGLDANVFNEKGLPCIALGIGIEEPHSPKEYIPVAQLDEGVRFLTAVLAAQTG